jgi:hypothetical protein
MIIPNLKNHVQFLTEVEPPRNYKNISSLDKVAEYIFHNTMDTLDFESMSKVIEGMVEILAD